MIDIARAEPHATRWDAEPLTWWPVRSDGRRTAILACDKGHAASLTGHAIALDGTVAPSVVCPHQGCDWHVFVRLAGWEP